MHLPYNRHADKRKSSCPEAALFLPEGDFDPEILSESDVDINIDTTITPY
jgi:hypothetical protein